MKPYFPILVILLLVSSSYVGVSNTVKELNIDKGEMEEQASSSNGGLMNSSWPMYCHDSRHTGQSQYYTENIWDEKWRFQDNNGFIRGSPVIGNDGIIYFGGSGYFFALYPNGTLKWKYGDLKGYVHSAPAISDDGTIYVGSWDDYLHAVYSNGTRKWRFCAYDNIASSPAIADDGTIYFGTMGTGHRILAVNPNGTEKWRYPTGDFIVSDPAVGNDGTIYIGSGDNYLYALNPNGTLRWRFGTGGDVKGHPSIAQDGTIYIGSLDGYLYALYSNGTMKWRVADAGGPSASIADDGTIYSGYNKLYAINPNGTVEWNITVGGWTAYSSPAISADGTIYVTNDGGCDIVAVNPDGTEKWRKQICDLHARSSPCIGEDGTVYVGSSQIDENTHRWYGYIHAFGPVDSNSPPETPTISGETNGNKGERYWYEIGSVDPDNNPVSFYIDWGDGTKGWTLDQASGEIWFPDHIWKKQGNYTIRVKAKDTLGEESNWATLEVTMPKTYNPVWWLNSLLDRFPLLSRLLGWILW